MLVSIVRYIGLYWLARTLNLRSRDKQDKQDNSLLGISLFHGLKTTHFQNLWLSNQIILCCYNVSETAIIIQCSWVSNKELSYVQSKICILTSFSGYKDMIVCVLTVGTYLEV